MLFSPINSAPPQTFSRTCRVLWHQGLDSLLKYPEIPRRTLNFDAYPLAKKTRTGELSLSGSVVTSHEGTIFDAEIQEVWMADALSMRAGFFYELLRFYNSDVSASNHLLWYPFDKTDKVFSIQPTDIVAGSSGGSLDVNPLHGLAQNDYRWLDTEIRFVFRVRRLYDPPSAAVSLEGA